MCPITALAQQQAIEKVLDDYNRAPSVEAANRFFSLLDQEEFTEEKIHFSPREPADSLRQQVFLPSPTSRPYRCNGPATCSTAACRLPMWRCNADLPSQAVSPAHSSVSLVSLPPSTAHGHNTKPTYLAILTKPVETLFAEY